MSVYLKAVQIGNISLVARVEDGKGQLMLLNGESHAKMFIADLDDMLILSKFFAELEDCREWDRARTARKDADD